MSDTPATNAVPTLKWERFGYAFSTRYPSVGSRLWVPGGWLIDLAGAGEHASTVFVPDPEHTWDAQYAAWLANKEVTRG